MVYVVSYCTLNLFADDALLWIETFSVETGIELMKNDLMNIIKFLNMHKIKLNLKHMRILFCGMIRLDISLDSNIRIFLIFFLK